MSFYDNLEFVITGTGRSASGYAALLINELGIPCGHEYVFGPERERREDLKGDSSWQAAPFLKDFNGKVIHQVRNPTRFIRSIVLASGQVFLNLWHPYGRQRLENSPWANEVLQPGQYHVTPEWAARHWIEWNRMIEPHADMWYNIETPDWKKVLQTLGYERTDEEIEAAIDRITDDYNPHVPKDWELPPGTIESLDIFDELKKEAKKYGYEI